MATSCDFSNQHSCFINGRKFLDSCGLCLMEFEVVWLFAQFGRKCSLQLFIQDSYRSTNVKIYDIRIKGNYDFVEIRNGHNLKTVTRDGNLQVFRAEISDSFKLINKTLWC